MKPLLKVQDLHVRFSNRYGEIHAVSGIDFELRPGEILGIVGESGCGKSAMAKSLVRLLPSQGVCLQGNVVFDGKNLLKSSEQELRAIRGKEIGFIFQDPMTSLNPTMKIGDQIIEGYRKHYPHISKQEALNYAVDLLFSIGIPRAAKIIFQYPHTLSGGMRQKVTIALALIARPKLLIADEPTTALDVTVQAQILSFMKSLQNITILIITHDLSVVAGFCDRVLVMYAGQIVEAASVEDLFYNPQHPYTQKLLQTIPRIDLPENQPLSPIEGHPPLLTSTFTGCSFAPRCTQTMSICREKKPPLLPTSIPSQSRCWRCHKDTSL